MIFQTVGCVHDFFTFFTTHINCKLYESRIDFIIIIIIFIIITIIMIVSIIIIFIIIIIIIIIIIVTIITCYRHRCLKNVIYQINKYLLLFL